MGHAVKRVDDSHAQMERRRLKAVQRILDGAKQVDVAEEFAVTKGAVSQWYSRYRKGGWETLHRTIASGRPILFKRDHRERLYKIISGTPWQWGYDTDLWTVRMARDTLEQQTGDRFSETRVLSEMHSLGFSFQKPRVAALEKKTTK